MQPWYEDDAFWETLERFFFSHVRSAAVTGKEIEQIVALLQPGEGARFLDLCCGEGRHALELAARGFSIVGVDRTARYLERARRGAAERGLTPEWVQQDMRAFVRPGRFEFALNLFSSFGYFDDPEDDLRVLRNVRESLAPGGKLLLEMIGKEIVARGFEPRGCHRLRESDEQVLEERTVRDGWDWIDVRWTVVRGDRSRTVASGMRIYSGVELAAALKQAGFSSVKLHGSLAATPYDDSAERLVAVARV